MKKSLVLALTVCAVLATSSVASAASPAAYRAKVNALCKIGVAKINAVPAPKSTKGYEAYFIKEATLGAQLLRQVTSVPPPVTLLPLVANALKLQGQDVTGIAVLAARIHTGTDPSKALKAAQKRLESLTKQANAAWRKAGLKACVG